MRWQGKRKWLGLLVAGAWLPIAISCSPGALSQGLRWADRYYRDIVIVDEYYIYDDCRTCGWFDGWGFDFGYLW